jgi:hypothetical protein
MANILGVFTPPLKANWFFSVSFWKLIKEKIQYILLILPAPLNAFEPPFNRGLKKYSICAICEIGVKKVLRVPHPWRL